MSVRLSSVAFACVGLLGGFVVGCGVEASHPQPTLTDVKVRPQSADVQAIQGGTIDNASTNVVGILIDTGGGIAICTGSLIAPNLVLTAHHCVAADGPGDITNCSATGHFGAQFAPSAFRVTMNTTAPAGVFQTGQWPAVDNSTWFGVSAVANSGSSICGGDMGVLRLSTNITSVCPLIPRVDVAPAQNEGFTAVGFGATSQSPTAPAGTRYTLNGFMSIACPNNCGPGFSQTAEWYGVSSATNRGVCEGDSGGPALDSLRRVLGTVSRGSATACDQAVYESTFGNGTWIKQQAQAAATAGGYPAAAWVTGGATSVNPCTGVDGGTGGGAGGGGGGPVGGGPTGGGGGGMGTCPPGQACFDVTGMGTMECLTTAGNLPTGAPTCSATQACPVGSTCFATMPGAMTGICLIDCGGGPVGGGGGAPVGGGPTGGGPTGGGPTGGGAPTMGSCTQAGTVCIDASGAGNFACVDLNTSNGIPAGSPTCSGTMPCSAGSSCWQTGSGNFCLQDCTVGPTGGGGGGAPIGGGTGGGVTGGGTGGGVTGGGTGGGVTGGGTGGGVTGGGTGGGVTGGGTGGGVTGGGATGGGTGGGVTGGGTAGGAGAGSGGVGGGFMFPGLPMTPKPTGCSCTEVPFDALALALSGVVLLRRRRRTS